DKASLLLNCLRLGETTLKRFHPILTIFLFLLTSGVAAYAQTLQATPSSLALSAQIGGASVSQNVSLTTSNGSPVSYIVSSNQTWLTVTPTSGATPATLTVTANPTGLSGGTY